MADGVSMVFRNADGFGSFLDEMVLIWCITCDANLAWSLECGFLMLI